MRYGEKRYEYFTYPIRPAFDLSTGPQPPRFNMQDWALCPAHRRSRPNQGRSPERPNLPLHRIIGARLDWRKGFRMINFNTSSPALPRPADREKQPSRIVNPAPQNRMLVLDAGRGVAGGQRQSGEKSPAEMCAAHACPP